MLSASISSIADIVWHVISIKVALHTIVLLSTAQTILVCSYKLALRVQMSQSLILQYTANSACVHCVMQLFALQRSDGVASAFTLLYAFRCQASTTQDTFAL